MASALEGVRVIDFGQYMAGPLAAQLLAAADLWLFVTTANRYADAVPWALLDGAAARDITVAVVLNRVPRRGAGSAYYGYQYTGDYYASSDDAVELPEYVPLVPATGSESALVEEPSARRAAEN